MHEHKFAHFDIKPANILYKKSHNGSYTFKLGDLGMCQNITELQNRIPEEFEEGDSRYVAREVLNLSDPNIDFYQTLSKADIFSLGLSIFQLIEQVRLEPNGPQWNNLRNGAFDFSQNAKATYSQQVLNLTMKMMDPEQMQRPSAEEIIYSIIGKGTELMLQ
jgi:serine/threonine protein kinase